MVARVRARGPTRRLTHTAWATFFVVFWAIAKLLTFDSDVHVPPTHKSIYVRKYLEVMRTGLLFSARCSSTCPSFSRWTRPNLNQVGKMRHSRHKLEFYNLILGRGIRSSLSAGGAGLTSTGAISISAKRVDLLPSSRERCPQWTLAWTHCAEIRIC